MSIAGISTNHCSVCYYIFFLSAMITFCVVSILTHFTYISMMVFPTGHWLRCNIFAPPKVVPPNLPMPDYTIRRIVISDGTLVIGLSSNMCSSRCFFIMLELGNINKFYCAFYLEKNVRFVIKTNIII